MLYSQEGCFYYSICCYYGDFRKENITELLAEIPYCAHIAFVLIYMSDPYAINSASTYWAGGNKGSQA